MIHLTIEKLKLCLENEMNGLNCLHMHNISNTVMLLLIYIKINEKKHLFHCMIIDRVNLIEQYRS